MKIAECMNRKVKIAGPEDTLRKAAKMMIAADAGILPVGENDRLVGMITDRDIAIRGIAEGKGPKAKVRDVMSAEVKYCFEDEDSADVLRKLGELKVRRLPVLSREKRLVGIVSLSDLAKGDHADGGGMPQTAEAFHRITEPGGPHDQTRH